MAEAFDCQTPGCGKKSTLRCPTCVKLDLKDSYFCSQECFTKYWPEHKKLHSKSDAPVASNGNGSTAATGKEPKQLNWPGYKFTGSLRPYEQTPRRTVPAKIPRPDYADDEEGRPFSEMVAKASAQIVALNDEECEAARVAGRLTREVLEECFKVVGVGVTTDEIDRVCHEACVERECYPSPLNYYQFPKSCCTSVNEVICHGIPDKRPLRDGEIVNVDVSVYHRGFHGDANETVFVGQVDEAGQHLVRTAWECLDKAIEASKPGVRYRDAGDVIQRHATAEGCSVVRTYCGHGVHRLFHCAPNVPHYAKNKAIGVMRPGHAFTIEPMINEGGWQDTTWPDDWTSTTRDGKRSAQFEHTLLVTHDGIEVLTRPLNGETRPYFLRQLANAV